jgi:hypothetical protein
MKIRSNPLYTHLLQAGVLNGTPEEISACKLEYRRLYKRQWKRVKRPRKEIRIEFTLKDFTSIKYHSGQLEIPHTTFARSAILAAVGINNHIHQKDQLLQILQFISISLNAVTKNTMTLPQIRDVLQQAETLFLDYLKI